MMTSPKKDVVILFIVCLFSMVFSVNSKEEVHVLFDFENGRADMAEWTLTGTVFNNQPTFGDNPTARNRGQTSNHKGNWWIGGAEDRPSKTATPGAVQLDGPTGTMTSPPFVIEGDQLRFLIGGGCDVKVERVELLIDGKVVAKATGRCHETMTTKRWDVRRFKEKEARIRLVDESSSGWGHINFDHLEVVSNPIVIKEEVHVLFDFENGRADMAEWILTGAAFNNQPTFGDNPTARNRGQPSNHKGNWWIGGYENRPSESDKPGSVQQDCPTGTMTSPPFIITGNKLRFLVGGGCRIRKERVELLIDGRAVAKTTGQCQETMTIREWPVRRFRGKEARVRLVDESSKAWGHINFDQLEMVTDPSLDQEGHVIFDFENGRADMAEWTLTGTVFNNQPTFGDNPTARNRGQPSNHKGNWWIGGAEDRPNNSSTPGAAQWDWPIGTMTSPPFVIRGNKLRFLIGGGCDMRKERVELLIDWQVVAKATGRCHETMTIREWPVRSFKGKEARVRLIDATWRGWGHINFDHLEYFD